MPCRNSLTDLCQHHEAECYQKGQEKEKSRRSLPLALTVKMDYSNTPDEETYTFPVLEFYQTPEKNFVLPLILDPLLERGHPLDEARHRMRKYDVDMRRIFEAGNLSSYVNLGGMVEDLSRGIVIAAVHVSSPQEYSLLEEKIQVLGGVNWGK